MERLKIGDIVKAKFPNSDKFYIGIIDAISMFNNSSIDNCEYSIMYDITEKQIEEAKNSQVFMPSAVHLVNGTAWFRRQDIVVLEKSRLDLYVKGDKKCKQ